jgi:carbonic anhydrase
MEAFAVRFQLDILTTFDFYFHLPRFHFHTPSEHRVDFGHYEAEMHFVFSAAGLPTFLAVMFLLS